MSTPEDDRSDAESSRAADDDSVPQRGVSRPRVRRTAGELTREERQFLERHRVDQPPHHDSSWG